jgi:lambda family phage portal protein
MIGSTIDRLVGLFSPAAAVRRTQQRRTLERMYQGAEANRLTNNKKPKNQSADSELLGPFGADALRAWSRALVRDNAYAWGVVDTIVSSVVGSGITAQSQVETPEGTDIEDVNELRDKVWSEWCEVCDVNGRLSFAEIQQLAQREMVEAGEVLIHFVNTPSEKYRGIYRPVPLAIELIEADRLANEKDTYKVRSTDGNRITRGVELDDLGKPLAYWIYPEHPNGPYTQGRQEPVRVDAKNILHLYRMDRIGQSRGVSWFAPVMSWLRDLGVYVDNEIQASAVASCFGVAIKTEGRAGTGLMPSTDSESTDDNGNGFEYLEPAMVVRLRPGESVESINPGRPNSASEPWINLMLRGISVGTGLSYEVVSRNYSGTSYSSSRTSMLEDRRRFRRWQKYMVQHCCQPIWDRFCEQAATAGVDGFPSMSEVLDDRRAATAVEWQTPAWEWVDPQSEQAASDAALTSFQSTYQDELGQRGKNWRNVFYQRAKEEKLKRSLGLVTADMANVEAAQAEAQQMAATGAAASGDTTAQQPAGEMSDMSRMQWSRNRKAIEDILAELIAGTASETKARVFLQTLGLTEATASALITDAMDGTVDTDLSQEPATETVQRSGKWVSTEDGSSLYIEDGVAKTGPKGKEIEDGKDGPKPEGAATEKASSKKTEDRRFPGRPKVGEVVNKVKTDVGVVSVVVSKAEDSVVDFGDKAGQVIDDAVQMQIKIGNEVIAETKVGTTAEAERRADKLLAKITENASKVGKTADVDSVTIDDKEITIEVTHDGYGGYHGHLTTTSASGDEQYFSKNGLTPIEPDFGSNPSRGEFKSPEQAKRILNKRAEKFAKAVNANDAEIAAIDAERLKNAGDSESDNES